MPWRERTLIRATTTREIELSFVIVVRPMISKRLVTLDQSEIEHWFREKHGYERWTILYQTGSMAVTGIGLYSCLIPVEKREDVLREPGWDLTIGSGGPGFSQERHGDESITTYHRLSDSDGIEPLVLVRTFHHGRPSYAEISEELRLLFNLYEDRQSGSFYEARDDGDEIEVIRTDRDHVEIRTSLLRRYLAARQMVLVLQIDSDVWLELSESQLVPQLPAERELSTEDVRVHFYSDLIDTHRPFSRLLGKKIMLPPARAECGIWPFEAPKQYLDFILGEDERGHPVEHTCNPDLLANYFGKNPDAPHYLTPMFFQREVLRKYYENSNRYKVEDGRIWCDGLWVLRVDNNHAEHVVVFLGDLGRDIPTSEQRHWRHYNIPPEERTLSETAFRRSFLGEFADADLPEHQFKNAYSQANEAWQIAFGWPLYKELHPDDQHVLSSLRLPLSNSANEFDSQVLNLAKLIIDSLNEEHISASLVAPAPKGEKGIAKFERLLTDRQYPNVSRDMALLRTIQGVRSRGAAHRKSGDYDLTQAGLNPKDLHESFKQLLERSTETLKDLSSFAASHRT